MELIPVMDLKQGQVVRGMAGERELYQPNRSRLMPGSDPVLTCRALLEQYRPSSLYLADLDGIAGGGVQTTLLEELATFDVNIAVDAGTASLPHARRLLELGVHRVIVALETLPRLDLVGRFVEELGADRVFFSLDLKDGKPLGAAAGRRQALEVVKEIVDLGVHQLIVLDLAGIGKNRGVPTLSLCHSIKRRWPDVVVWTGGGVRSVADLHALAVARVDGAMVASALHDGGITPADWDGYESLSDDRVLRAMDA